MNRKPKVFLSGLLLGIITLTIIILFNYVAFLKQENYIFLTNINESILRLQKSLNDLEKEMTGKLKAQLRPIIIKKDIKNHLDTERDSSGNRGFIIRNGQPSSEVNL